MKYKVLFVDDVLSGNNDQNTIISGLNREQNLKVTVMHPVDAIVNLENSDVKDYSLIIVDYKLNSNPHPDGRISKMNGYSLTSMFKEKLPNIPVYLISEIIVDEVSMGEHYDKKLSRHVLTIPRGKALLASDCEDHRLLFDKFESLGDSDSLGRLLKVPKESIESFKNSLPIEFKGGLSSNADPVQDSEPSFIRFAKWINQVLLNRSGPLMDEKELAILFGLEFDYFNNKFKKDYESELADCEYQGVFSRSNEPRWWSQAAFNFAVKLADEEYVSNPSEQIPKVLNIDEKHWSKCVICTEYFPECIAFEASEEKLDKGYPAHWRCTLSAEDQVDMLGFNPILYLDESQSE